LTEGYARALGLEAERWRLERRIGEVAGEIGDGGDPRRDLLAGLRARLTEATEELTRLRAVLSALKVRTEQVRDLAAL
jgi:hypothetical protein